MDLKTIRTLMFEIPLFDLLDDSQRETMLKFVKYSICEKGKRIFKEGTPGNFFYFIVDGKVEIVKESVTGKNRPIGIRQKGSSIGEMAMVDDGAMRTATARAVETTKFLYLSRDDFETLIDKHPRIAVRILRNIAAQLSSRLNQASGQLADI